MNRFKCLVTFICTLSLLIVLNIQGESHGCYGVISRINEYGNGGKSVTAYHEAAHVLVALKKDCGSVLISVCLQHDKESVGHVSLSGMRIKTYEQKINTIIMLLAGGISEQLVKRKKFVCKEDGFWDLLEGANLASDDLFEAREIAKELLQGTHDSFRIIPRTFKEEEDELLEECYHASVKLLKEHQNDIKRIAENLLKKTFLTADEVRTILKKQF